jgi:hypothetical protein
VKTIVRCEDDYECASESLERSDSDLLNVLHTIRKGTKGKTTISLKENSRHQEWASLGLPSHIYVPGKLEKMRELSGFVILSHFKRELKI